MCWSDITSFIPSSGIPRGREAKVLVAESEFELQSLVYIYFRTK